MFGTIVTQNVQNYINSPEITYQPCRHIAYTPQYTTYTVHIIVCYTEGYYTYLGLYWVFQYMQGYNRSQYRIATGDTLYRDKYTWTLQGYNNGLGWLKMMIWPQESSQGADTTMVLLVLRLTHTEKGHRSCSRVTISKSM